MGCQWGLLLTFALNFVADWDSRLFWTPKAGSVQMSPEHVLHKDNKRIQGQKISWILQTRCQAPWGALWELGTLGDHLPLSTGWPLSTLRACLGRVMVVIGQWPPGPCSFKRAPEPETNRGETVVGKEGVQISGGGTWTSEVSPSFEILRKPRLSLQFPHLWIQFKKKKIKWQNTVSK